MFYFNKGDLDKAISLIEDEKTRHSFELLRNLPKDLNPTEPESWDYEKYLRSAKWKKIRKRVLDRDQGLCQYCDGKASLVHHRSYARTVLEGKDDSQLSSLCSGCHEFLHFEESGVERSREETDRLLLTTKAPTDLPKPIADLRIKFPKPSGWSRLSDVQQQRWSSRNYALRLERQQLHDVRKARRLNSSPISVIEESSWIRLDAAVNTYNKLDSVRYRNAYGSYRADAASCGFVQFDDTRVEARKIGRAWHIRVDDLARATRNLDEKLALLQKMTIDYGAGIYHGEAGTKILTTWGYYRNHGEFIESYWKFVAMRGRNPTQYKCCECNQRGSIEATGMIKCCNCGTTMPYPVSAGHLDSPDS